MKPSVIIISYTFPPQSGIGGRRWAKFAKYFDRKGYDVSIISSPTTDSLSHWNSDVTKVQNSVIRVQNDYPAILRKVPNSIFEKLKYRAALFLIKQRIKGNYFDHSTLWSKNLIEKLAGIIDKEKRFVIVASGGPFAYMTELLTLKSRFPKLKLIADFRDPWANNETSFGYSELSDSRMQCVLAQQQLVIDGFDAIVSVADPMTSYFSSLKTNVDSQSKFATLRNGFDREDWIESSDSLLPKNRINIVFTGSLYDKTYHYISNLVSVLKSDSFDFIQLHFYGEMNSEMKVLLHGNPNISVHGSVDRRLVSNAISEADYCLLVLTKDLTYSFSTKFCEYAMHQKPIFVISEEGICPTYIKENALGLHALPNTTHIRNSLNKLEKNSKPLVLNQRVEREFDVSLIAEQYLSLIDRVHDIS